MSGRVFTMPDLGEGLEEGEIVAWLVEVGDTVALNQPLVEVETAKAAVEIPSPFAGVVTELHGRPGGSIPVGAPLVTFDGGEAPSPDVPDSSGHEAVAETGVAEPVVGSVAGSGESVKATPPVRKLAKDLGIDLASVAGTGPAGRITAEDVRAAADGGRETAGSAVAGATLAASTRRAIADNLERQAAIPQVTVFRTVDCTALEARRGELGTSPLPLVIAALTRTVAEHPALNARWHDGDVEDRAAINVGLAVDTERGLVVAVLREAASHGIADLSTEIKRLADAARSGSLTPAAMTGATVAVSNTGSYGSEAGTPILSPGTSITLAIGVIGPRALVVDGEVVARPACTLSCTFDHRVLDGATVGRALTDLVHRLENQQALGDLPA
jgi:2-oxoisovalerate dehydrogenase E2 component (dihydrolipoyl transacylase)